MIVSRKSLVKFIR